MFKSQNIMAIKMSAVLLTGLLIISMVSVTFAISGTASFYTNYVPSECYGNQDQGTMIATVSDALWNNGAACGKRYRITCTGPTNCKGGSVTVKIVDHCPSPCQATIELSREAFSVIAGPNAGKIQIDYTQ